MKFEIDPESTMSITTELELYCDENYKKGLLGTAFFVVSIISTSIFGIMV
jgi:hypothetical protein